MKKQTKKEKERSKNSFRLEAPKGGMKNYPFKLYK